MITDFLLLLVPLAMFAGWYLGHKHKPAESEWAANAIPREYFVGLNYLLNEQPDKAVDIFIKMLEVNSDTVETHLALGSLFRRQGEVDRAIRIHQNLIARPNLNKQQRIQSLLALGQDYLRAGVFDRAERIFLEVVAAGEQIAVGLRHLLDIYQQEKNWQRAIVIANQLIATTGKVMHQYVAHYYCELAIEAQTKNQLAHSQKYLKQALTIDWRCVRASLLMAELEKQKSHYKSAIRYYQQVREQDPDYLSETIMSLANCYKQLGKEAEFIDYLQRCLAESPRISIVLAIADHLQEQQGESVAVDFIAGHLQQRPSIRGLQRLIKLHRSSAVGATKENLNILYELVLGLLRNKPAYCCEQCGFNSKILHWLCPGCKNWNTVKPIHN